jgi:hypothetical protein
LPHLDAPLADAVRMGRINVAPGGDVTAALLSLTRTELTHKEKGDVEAKVFEFLNYRIEVDYESELEMLRRKFPTTPTYS